MNTTEIKARFQATNDVQVAIAQEWLWTEKSLDQWAQDLDHFTELEEAESAAHQTEINIRTQRDALFNALERRTMQSVAMLKVAARTNAAHTELLKKLPGPAEGRPQVLARAQAVYDAWKQILPQFAPTPELTHANLESAIFDARALDAQTSEGKTRWRRAAETLAEFAAECDADAKAWYSLATRLFASGTATGDLIRGRIPTDYQRRPTKA